jgi:hypothetical protein
MDTLFWTQSNPKITIEHTTKKYFGLYLRKLVLYAPAGRILEKGWQNVEIALQARQELAKRRINWGGSWYNREASINDADTGFLTILGRLKNDPAYSDTIRFRIEEPYITLYADEEQTLKDIVTQHIAPTYSRYITSVTMPIDDDAVKHLNEGAILRKKDYGYKYKVIIRDGKYSSDVKQALLTYLTSLDETFLTKGCVEQLSKDLNYVWNAFFYTNDPDVIHFVNLIAPNSIANIHELVVVDNK